MVAVFDDKRNRLFLFLAAFFVANALIAEFVGVKIFSLEKTFGLTPADLSLFGEDGLSFNLTAGVLLWPVVFVMTDVINEYYGRRGVRLLTLIAVALISYAFLMFFVAIHLSPADFWIERETEDGTINMELAFKYTFGQGLRIIIGSLVAFVVSQFLDAIIFQRIKRITGGKMVWLRATGSTLISQFIDSFVVLFIAFYGIFEMKFILAIGIVGYMYKFIMAIVLTPIIYLGHYIIDIYLGKEQAEEMKKLSLEYD